MIGVGIRGVGVTGGLRFSPSKLFTGTTAGAWYDPSDITTLYRDAAGTLPVTAVEQPVGLMLDKSKGLVLGPELVTNGTFGTDISGWTRTTAGVTISWDTGNLKIVYASGLVAGATAPIPVISGKTYKIAGDLTVTGSGVGSIQLFASATPSDWSSGQLATSSIANAGTGKTSVSLIYTATSTTTLYVGAGFRGTPASGATILADNISVRELPGNRAFNSSGNSANFPVLSARYNLYVNTETLATQNVTTVAASYKLAFTGTGSITLSGTATGTYSAGTHTITCAAGTLTSTVSGTVTQADLRVANDAMNQPAYQRVNTSTDYDTVGFKPAEVFDGVDDNLIASAGGGSTTAFFWCSAIRVGKVGAVQTLFSDAGTNTGYRVRINASNQLELSAGNGTAYTTVATTATLSIGQRAVLTAWHDGTNLNVQINNGTVHQAAFAMATAGTAQFTIGKDNNAASNFFAGRLYEKVYTKDNVPSSSQITSTKTYVANAAGITL